MTLCFKSLLVAFFFFSSSLWFFNFILYLVLFNRELFWVHLKPLVCNSWKLKSSNYNSKLGDAVNLRVAKNEKQNQEPDFLSFFRFSLLHFIRMIYDLSKINKKVRKQWKCSSMYWKKKITGKLEFYAQQKYLSSKKLKQDHLKLSATNTQLNAKK